MGIDTNHWQFNTGCILTGKTSTPFFSIHERGKPDCCQFRVYFDNTWHKFKTITDWPVIAMTGGKDPMDSQLVVVALSTTGKVWEVKPKLAAEVLSEITSEEDFTNLATIGSSIYACGMGRILMRRESLGQWSDLSAPLPEDKEAIIGFTAIAGLDSSAIFAVGWKGEIWILRGNVWEKEKTPTEANLNAIAISPDGIIYVVGDHGAILKGTPGNWELIEFDLINFTDVCIYEEEIYVSTDFQVFKLNSLSELESEFNGDSEDVPGTCLKLISTTSLYSIGPNDIFEKYDGKWVRLA